MPNQKKKASSFQSQLDLILMNQITSPRFSKMRKKFTSLILLRKELKKYELDFENPGNPGVCHIKNDLYHAGGSWHGYLSIFRKISCLGEVQELAPLPTGKAEFPMVYWEREDVIISVGGSNASLTFMTEVVEYSRAKNEWKALPSLPEPIGAS